MRSFWIFWLEIAIIVGGWRRIEIDANKSHDFGFRIIGGRRAEKAEFPHLVSLRWSKSAHHHFCSGNIIAPQWVLTAQHCLLLTRKIYVVAGETELSDISNSTQWTLVAQKIRGKWYNKITMENDIAILKLLDPFKFNEFVQAIPMVSNETPIDTVCEVSGWGATKYKGKISKYLMVTEVPILNISACEQVLREKFLLGAPKGMLCSGYKEGKRDACQGDSGGGLVCGGLLTGIVSFGIKCAEPGYPGIYTNVAFYKKWINDSIEPWIVEERSSASICGVSSMIASVLLAFLI